MRWLIILAVISALAQAKPEKYREQEDFQYSRSSSDDGTKSGYYGAQRGNMGGNYERAHNMDTLAQNQMSGLVRQVEGELGAGANTRTGSVFSAASSRGIYGSGGLDTSNLQGRNFAEGVSYGNSNLHSSLTQSSLSHHNSADTNRYSQSYGAHRRTTSDAQTQTDDLQSMDNLHSSNHHTYGSTRHSSGFQSEAGFQEQKHYDSGSTNFHSGHGSNMYSVPVRIVVTPGRRVAVPLTTHTFDATHGSSSSSQFNHNTIDSEAGTISDSNLESFHKPRYYEASYRYNKKWEKHDTVPTSVVIPTVSPIPKNSELYEDVDVLSGSQNSAHETDIQQALSSSASGRYNAAKLSSSQYGHNTNYNSEQYQGGSSNSNSNLYSHTGHEAQQNHGFPSDSLNAFTQAQRNTGSTFSGYSTGSDLSTQAKYNAGSQLDLSSQVEDLSTKPKSYHSSYSYHKSWERQGDPYIIKPASSSYTDSHTSQRLTSSTKNLRQYGQRSCEEDCHIRVARSHGTDNQDIEQQSQSLYEGQDLSQQVQGSFQNLEDMGQVAQKSWDQQTNGQQSLNQWDNFNELGQQSQNNWNQENVEQQSQNQWDNLKDLSQQSQNKWNEQNVEQQSQNEWDKLKDLNQQSQNNWNQENVEQQSQNQWDNLKDLGQQSQNKWNEQNVEQQSQNQWDNLKDLSQISQQSWSQQNVEQQSNSDWSNMKDLSQLSQQAQNNWDLGQTSQNNWDQQSVGQQSNINWDKIDMLDQQSNINWEQQSVGQQADKNWDKLENLNQQSEQQSLTNNMWDKFENIGHNTQRADSSDILRQHARNFVEHQNQDTEKLQNDLYEKYAPKPNNDTEPKPNIAKEDKIMQNSQSMDEVVYGKRIDSIWDKFDKINVATSNIKNETESMVQKVATSYGDTDTLFQKESDSDIANNKNNIDIEQNQKESNDNSDYGYSGGFVNPFLQYHKKRLSHIDNTYLEHNIAFQSNTWNSNDYSYNNSYHSLQKVNNSYTNRQDTPLTSLWSKFDKIESELGLDQTSMLQSTNNSKINNTFLVANQNETRTTNQPWYVQNPHQTNISPDSGNQEHKGLLDDKTSSGEKPETSQDTGRGDIGPEEITDINVSNKSYHKPTSAVSQTTYKSYVNQDNINLQSGENNNMVNVLPEEKLTVLGLQQQEDKYKIDLSNKTYVASNTLQSEAQYKENLNKSFIIDIQNKNYNGTQVSNINQNHVLLPIEIFETQTEIKTEKDTISLNYDTHHQDHESELQKSVNFEQENVNMEQDNTSNFGQEDFQVFTQQNENLESQYLHNFQDILQDFQSHNDNLEQQNLYNFGQEQSSDDKQENVDHRRLNNSEINTQIFQGDVTQTNLSRVQKSIGRTGGKSNSDIDQDEVLHVQQEVQDLQTMELIPPQIQQSVDYNIPSINSFEQDFEQQSSVGKLNNFEPKSQIVEDIQQNRMVYDTTISTSTTITPKASLQDERSEKVTEKPGFWKSVGNKFSSAKDTIVSWFRS